ncbi:HlyD family type I secretion periplasmic adaptor subunit [Laribacter hongkongensis]|uniref:HlyD family type I secretion periplasmic adaptor subunit n=1 Tax=Laribacter hongkongensis TaxID=168471 RepID=UPI0003F4C8DD|nr:HlyD family type I secretion periplasmic adaptor subunit [Laribacter hongkongensis]MCG8994584.1 HlyD family type I secretion periplasmic adaptor subunit [Laribacter hongkongensis]MCG9009237.1 HlyD family type I secretion periplasmic adaptor subunit [Laribacter hongkongensis]MCG9021852.1 HlyD family type I secretion periplasmic adaptor subunit [Laribacter hongkongensis]MCG9045581.1 HlyD family type I secretion periplasmic adaptor subunit [Laribacter hongkongensis]MCG9073014.1 HlyD family typ
MNKPELPPSVPGSGEEAPASTARHRLLAAVVARFNLWRSRVDRKLDQWLSLKEQDDQQDFVTDAEWFMREESPRRPRIFVWSMLGCLLVAVLWAAFAKIDEVSRGEGKVVPSGQNQVLQSLDGGVVTEILARPGQTVKKGELLLKIDSTRFVSNLRENQAQYYALQAKGARLRALANDVPFEMPAEVTQFAPGIAQQEMELYTSRKMELDASVSIARQQMAQRTQELREAQARRAQAAQSYDLTAQELRVTRPLKDVGAVSEVDLLRLERDLARFRGERDMAGAQIPRTQAAIDEARRKIEEVELAFRNEASTQLTETMGKLNALSEGSVALQDKVRQTEIRSPVRGEVKQLFTNTVGGVVQPGKDIIEIVPLEASLLLETRISPRDIAFLHPGQKAVVRFTAYDFTIYGGMEGVLETIGADTITDEKGNAFYVVKVRTKGATLGDMKLPIIPGMVAQVDIMTGKKTVLSYLLKPVLRAKATALSER